MKNFLISLAMLATFALVGLAHAGTLAQEQAAQFGLNQASPNEMASHLLGTKVMLQSDKIVYGTFDVTSQGGGAKAYPMKDQDGRPVYLPKGSMVEECILIVQTAVTNKVAVSGSGTNLKVDLGTQSLVGNNTSMPARISGCAIQPTMGSYPTYISAPMLAGDAQLIATISTPVGIASGLSAGKVTAILRYLIGPAQ